MKINFSINYKGYTADVSYEPEDKIYVGEVRGISDSLNFHGRSILEINTMFHQSIENYLDLCKQIGKDPERAADYKLACRIYTCISDNTDCMAEPEAVEALREAVLKSGKAGAIMRSYRRIAEKQVKALFRKVLGTLQMHVFPEPFSIFQKIPLCFQYYI